MNTFINFFNILKIHFSLVQTIMFLVASCVVFLIFDIFIFLEFLKYLKNKNLPKEKKVAINLELDSPNVISVKNLKFKYFKDHNDYILKNLNFDIKKNDYVVIVGHNGSGKSTFAKILTNVLSSYEGKIYFFNNLKTKNNEKAIAKHLGIVFQNPENQFIGATVKDDIIFGLENQQKTKAEIDKIIEDVATKLDIKELLNKTPFELSGGQKQKVAIASVLALNPEIIIFDESTSILDPNSQIEIKGIMKDLKEKYNKTVISITHDMEELINADKVLIFNDGEVVKYDTTENIINDVELLQSLKLDVPKILKLCYFLNKKGIKISPTLDRKEFAKRLWTLK